MLREIFDSFDNNPEVWDYRLWAGICGIALGTAIYGQFLVR